MGHVAPPGGSRRARGRSMSQSSTATPFPLDLLRRQAITLASAAGLPAALAADLAHHVLWYETLGAFALGLGTLPTWLADRSLATLDLTSVGEIRDEHTGTACLDASRTLPPLAMSQAAAIAAEKARENGAAVIQVENLNAPCSAGDVAAREAIGPVAVAVLTARPSWSVALPSAGGLPFLADSDLGPKPASAKSRAAKVPPWVATLAPLLAGFAPQPGGATVLALHVSALGSLDAFRDRLAASFPRAGTWLEPARLAEARREAEQRGLPIAEDLRRALDSLAARLGVPGLEG